MASGVKPRVKVPKTAAAGDSITIKTLISHKMESGQRKDKEGNVIPRSIINRFTCDFNGRERGGRDDGARDFHQPLF